MSFSTWPGYLAGHRWASEPATPSGGKDDDVNRTRRPRAGRQQWTRALGVLETKFDKATQTDGQSDTFVRLALSLDVPSSSSCSAGPSGGDSPTSAFLSRLLLAWAALRAKHPLLACTVRDAPPDKLPSIPLVQTREFVLEPPLDATEALQRSGRAFLVHGAGDGESVKEATDQVQERQVLNGPRALLAQDECLARLVLVRSEREPHELGFVLVISHVVRLAWTLEVPDEADSWARRRAGLGRALRLQARQRALCARFFARAAIAHDKGSAPQSVCLPGWDSRSSAMGAACRRHRALAGRPPRLRTTVVPAARQRGTLPTDAPS